jgi:hypothetical protein
MSSLYPRVTPPPDVTTLPTVLDPLNLGLHIRRNPQLFDDVSDYTWLSSEDIVFNGTLTTPTPLSQIYVVGTLESPFSTLSDNM